MMIFDSSCSIKEKQEQGALGEEEGRNTVSTDSFSVHQDLNMIRPTKLMLLL